MSEIKLEIAEITDLDEIINVILDRCKWFDEKNIIQWEADVYLKIYNRDYFKEMINSKQFYIVKENNSIIGIMLLKENDTNWDDDQKALYIHHFTTKTGSNGLGNKMILCAKEIAKSKNKEFLRLDCQDSNLKLNDYYEQLGFILKGHGAIEGYAFNLRELKI